MCRSNKILDTASQASMERTSLVSMLAFFKRQSCTVATSPLSAARSRSAVAFACVRRGKVKHQMSVEDGRGYRHYTLFIMEIVLIALTTTAAAITARTQPCASGEEQCFALRSDSLRVIPKNSRTSPAQSSSSSSKSWTVAASWAMNTCCAHATIAARAAGGAHRKAESS